MVAPAEVTGKTWGGQARKSIRDISPPGRANLHGLLVKRLGAVGSRTLTVTLGTLQEVFAP
jgi:hypothetical protein